jgi:hypothetical protein
MTIGEPLVVRPDEFEPPKRWWQNPKWIASIAALIFVIGNGTWAAVSVKTQTTLEARAKVGDQILELAKKIDNNQTGIDTLVSFVNKVIADQAAQGADQTLPTLFEVLCGSSDPVQISTCRRLQDEGKIPKTFKPGGG